MKKKTTIQKKTKSAPEPKTAKANKNRQKTSALNAAAQVLEKTGKPMRCREMIVAMSEARLWKSPGGKTPQATLYSSILREIENNGGKARFKKVERGLFAFNG